MKIVICHKCADLVAVGNLPRQCGCGNVEAMFLDNGRDILVSGMDSASVFAVHNADIINIIKGDFSPGAPMRAWLLPNDHEQIIRTKPLQPKA
jgi:hypothetical protein